MSTIAATTLKNTKLFVPIVTLSSKNNVKLVKLLQEGFKRPVFLEWAPSKNRNKRVRQ